MVAVVPVAQNIAFEPEMTAVMGAAFDKACQSLNLGAPPALLKETIARRILDVATEGERNPDRLCERALATLAFARDA